MDVIVVVLLSLIDCTQQRDLHIGVCNFRRLVLVVKAIAQQTLNCRRLADATVANYQQLASSVWHFVVGLQRILYFLHPAILFHLLLNLFEYLAFFQLLTAHKL